jgi:hypothetical protein
MSNDNEETSGQRERRQRNHAMLLRARKGLRDLRAATWEAHHDLGILKGEAHSRGVSAYTVIDELLDKLAAHPLYRLDE